MAGKKASRGLTPRFTAIAGVPSLEAPAGPAFFGRVVVDPRDYRAGRISVDADGRWILRADPRPQP